jgi:hypothetical protein
MILLPQVSSVDFQEDTRKAGAWLSEDPFVVVPKNLDHQTTTPRRGHEHLAIYATDDQLAKIETRLGSHPRIEENGMLKDYKFLEEGEQRPVTVPIADSYTNTFVDAVAPSVN